MTDKELLKHCIEENSLSYNELKEMTQEELDQVFSMCWKDPDYNGGYNERTLRASATGIRYLIYHKSKNSEWSSILDWSDDEGDPNIDYDNPDQKVHHLGDGTWKYGIYKSVEQVKRDKRDNKIQEILN